MPRTSAADLSHGLKGAHFPMNARQLAEHARQNRAPDEVIETLKHLPNREFDSLADVEHAFSERHEGGQPKGRGPAEEARKGATHRRKQ